MYIYDIYVCIYIHIFTCTYIYILQTMYHTNQALQRKQRPKRMTKWMTSYESKIPQIFPHMLIYGERRSGGQGNSMNEKHTG